MVAAMAAETEGAGSGGAPAMDPDVAAMMQAGPVSDPSMLTVLIAVLGGLMILGFVVWVLTRQPAAHRPGGEQRQAHDGDGAGDGSD